MIFELVGRPEKTGEVVESVIYHLHPTFKVNKIAVKEPPFKLNRAGWGYFEIKAEVTF